VALGGRRDEELLEHEVVCKPLRKVYLLHCLY
jgi:hypothetical protein